MRINLDTAHEIIKYHFGKAPKKLVELTGGLANFTYDATVDGDRYIIRITDNQEKWQHFLKEQWAVQKAKEKKVPVPEIMEVASEAAPTPYMLVKHIEGHNAERHEKRIDAIHEMGKYAAIINTIPTSGYGHVFDWSNNKLSLNENWKDYLVKELEYELRIGFYEKKKILDPDQISELKKIFNEMAGWKDKPTLSHGDLRLKNVILNENGKIIALIDWENCLSQIAPYWDLSIALHDLSIDEKEVFLDGYGMSPQEYKKKARFMKALNIINYFPWIEKAYEEKDEAKRKAVLDRIKNRLRGYHDLFSI